MLLIAVLLLVSAVASQEPKIAGGHNVTIEERPFQVMLVGNDTLCGGSIVSERFVLTAARCVEWKPVETIVVMAGAAKVKTFPVEAKQSAILLHPLHNGAKTAYDAALVKVDRDFVFDAKIQPVTLASQVPSNGSLATVSGWGGLQEGGTVFTDDLREAPVTVIDRDACAAMLGEEFAGPISEYHLCTFTSGKGPCLLDHGGPLTDSSGRLVGITSWEMECGSKDKPVVYTSVPAIRDWVEATIHNHAATHKSARV